ncbi:hypothetical protein ADK74_17175 [Streptomyces decoyicus]|nr:hypothetical protein ADK74_17175 [Streptomyces decoyicus]
MIGAGPWVSAGRTWRTNAFEDRNQLWGTAPLDGGDDERERTVAALTGQMDLAGPPATGTSQGLI